MNEGERIRSLSRQETTSRFLHNDLNEIGYISSTLTLPASETKETIRVLEGVEEVARGTLRFIRNARGKIDVCSDSNGPSVVMGLEASKRLIVEWKDSGK